MILLGILLVDWIDCSLNLWSWLSTILSPLVVVFYVCVNKLLAFSLSWEMKWDIVDLCVYYFNIFSNVLTSICRIQLPFLFILSTKWAKNNGVLCVAMLHERRSMHFCFAWKENSSATKISSNQNVISESAVLHHVDIKYLLMVVFVDICRKHLQVWEESI